MKAPRFRLAWIMLAVAIAALDFWAIQTVIGVRDDRIRYVIGTFLLVGGLPMANVLLVGMMIRQRQSESRPFLLGFEVFGVIAMVTYVALAILPPAPDGPLTFYLSFLVRPIETTMGRDNPLFIPIICFVAVVMFSLPQLAFALLGGFLSRRFKVIVVRR
jgi:hypothetical protein